MLLVLVAAGELTLDDSPGAGVVHPGEVTYELPGLPVSLNPFKDSAGLGCRRVVVAVVVAFDVVVLPVVSLAHDGLPGPAVAVRARTVNEGCPLGGSVGVDPGPAMNALAAVLGAISTFDAFNVVSYVLELMAIWSVVVEIGRGVLLD